MRLLVHVLARLAITATCTNSAAALDVQAGSPEISFLHQQSVGVSDVEFSIGDRASGVTAPRDRPRALHHAIGATILPNN